MQYDNPAARLVSILSEGRKIAAADPCRTAWSLLLETPESDASLLVCRIGKLMGLPQEIIQQTRELYPTQPPTWNHWSKQVNLAFANQNINAQWHTFIQHIDDHTINYLVNSAELLQAKSVIKQLDPDLVKDFRSQIDGLLLEVTESDLAVEIKKYICRHLRQILNALDEYKITGALPILEAVESTVGHAFLDKVYRDDMVNSPIGQKILGTLAAVSNLVTIAIGIPELPHALKLLEKIV